MSANMHGIAEHHKLNPVECPVITQLVEQLFPVAYYYIEDVFEVGESGDKIGVHWQVRNACNRQRSARPLLSKQALSVGTTVIRYHNTQILEAWESWDRLGDCA